MNLYNVFKLDRSFRIFPTPIELAEAFAIDLVNLIKEAENNKSPVMVALSGGNTPKLLFSVLADKYAKSVNWSYIHFFWGDERCVPPDDPESNYGMTSSLLLNKIIIPENNIHRIRGENDPEKEALRYSEEIMNNTRSIDELPMFDLIILGLGDDGHTASIFPENIELLDSGRVCEVAVHPVSGQKRVTITGKVINNADAITFLVTGHPKAHIVEGIFKNRKTAACFPAFHVNSSHGKVLWLLDKNAGEFVQ